LQSQALWDENETRLDCVLYVRLASLLFRNQGFQPENAEGWKLLNEKDCIRLKGKKEMRRKTSIA
jgi:hypothetical protein